MSEKELINKLHQLLALQSENEIVGFKEANNNYDFKKLGKYFSALSNEAKTFSSFKRKTKENKSW